MLLTLVSLVNLLPINQVTFMLFIVVYYKFKVALCYT